MIGRGHAVRGVLSQSLPGIFVVIALRHCVHSQRGRIGYGEKEPTSLLIVQAGHPRGLGQHEPIYCPQLHLRRLYRLQSTSLAE